MRYGYNQARTGQKFSPYENYLIGSDPNFEPIEQHYGYTAPPFDRKATKQEKNEQAAEAMKQFNLFSFQKAAPGTIFGLGDPGFQSPMMKAKKAGFRNVYNSLFGKAPPSIIPSGVSQPRYI
jgi:hypothetical protein